MLPTWLRISQASRSRARLSCASVRAPVQGGVGGLQQALTCLVLILTKKLPESLIPGQVCVCNPLADALG